MKVCARIYRQPDAADFADGVESIGAGQHKQVVGIDPKSANIRCYNPLRSFDLAESVSVSLHLPEARLRLTLKRTRRQERLIVPRADQCRS